MDNYRERVLQRWRHPAGTKGQEKTLLRERRSPRWRAGRRIRQQPHRPRGVKEYAPLLVASHVALELARNWDTPERAVQIVQHASNYLLSTVPQDKRGREQARSRLWL